MNHDPDLSVEGEKYFKDESEREKKKDAASRVGREMLNLLLGAHPDMDMQTFCYAIASMKESLDFLIQVQNKEMLKPTVRESLSWLKRFQ